MAKTSLNKILNPEERYVASIKDFAEFFDIQSYALLRIFEIKVEINSKNDFFRDIQWATLDTLKEKEIATIQSFKNVNW